MEMNLSALKNDLVALMALYMEYTETDTSTASEEGFEWLVQSIRSLRAAIKASQPS